jgi:CHAD domain-containing protein
MSYRLHFNDTLAEGFPRIASGQIDRAVTELAAEDAVAADVVHQVRKRCKKFRGLLRLIRGSFGAPYAQENAWFRDLARRLSGTRDADVLVECMDKLGAAFNADPQHGALLAVRRALAQRRDAVHHATAEPVQLDEIAGQLEDARIRALGWPLEVDGFDAVASGLMRTYRRARKALHAGYRKPTPERFHEWRKRVKYHWYHLRLLREIWPEQMKGRAAEAKRLADLLGDDHDLSVLRKTLARDGNILGDHGQREAVPVSGDGAGNGHA